jgi:SSS family solute:Na+ symporter
MGHEARGKAKLSTEQHLTHLKRGVVGVAIFAWCFSMVFPVQEYIFMYFQATGAIFTGGAGAVLIGGLYWRRGTTGAAWASMIVGSTLAVVGVLTINIIWPWLVPFAQGRFPAIAWVQTLPGDFWMNGLEWGFSVSVIALLTYVVVSLASPRGAVDFDKLFYRGQYAVEGKEGEPDYVPKVEGKAVPGWARKLGVTEEFTAGDKWIFGLKYALFGWTFGVGFLGLTLAYVFGFMRSDQAWINWWTIYVVSIGLVGTAATVWFLIGGFKDLFAMLRRLKTLQRDDSDDGTVTQHLGEPEDDGDTAPKSEAAS